jgi:hypothetical protein
VDIVVLLNLQSKIAPAPNLVLELVPLPTRNVYALYVSRSEFPNSDRVEITDETLLEKLRSVNGQFTWDGLPILYYENLPATLGV